MRAGSVAKFALVAEAKEHNPQSVGGAIDCGPEVHAVEFGRFDDKGETETSDTFTQSLAIIALRGCEAGDCPGSPNLKAWIGPAGTFCANSSAKAHRSRSTEHFADARPQTDRMQRQPTVHRNRT